MANFKVVISDPKSRKAYQKEIDQSQSGLIGKKIGDKAPGSHLGLVGFELEITGGSDKEGFPMRRDFESVGRKKLLLSHPPGFHPKSKGRRKRKSIRGNTISPSISQVNMKIVVYGTKSIEESLGVKKDKETAPKEEKHEKKEHVEKKEHTEKPKESHAEKPKEDKHVDKPKEEHAHKHTENPAEKSE